MHTCVEHQWAVTICLLVCLQSLLFIPIVRAMHAFVTAIHRLPGSYCGLGVTRARVWAIHSTLHC